MHTPAPAPNGDLTLREAERLLTAGAAQVNAHQREHELLLTAHQDIHAMEKEARQTAEAAQKEAVATALRAVDKTDTAARDALKSALVDHHRQHETHDQAHSREHTLVSDALLKAEHSMDRRLDGIVALMNERDKAYVERFDGILRVITAAEAGVTQRFLDTSKHTDDRYEDNRKRIEIIEKGDVQVSSKAEGKSLGTAAVIAAILGAASFTSFVVGIIVIIINILTKGA